MSDVGVSGAFDLFVSLILLGTFVIVLLVLYVVYRF